MELLLSLSLLPLIERVVADPGRVGGGSRTRCKYLRGGVTAVALFTPALLYTQFIGVIGVFGFFR